MGNMMSSFGDVGDIAGIVGSVVVLAISAIVLLTFAPTIAGDINEIALLSNNACTLNGERFDRVTVPAATTNTANQEWAAVTGASGYRILTATTCAAPRDAEHDEDDGIPGWANNQIVFTPGGQRLVGTAESETRRVGGSPVTETGVPGVGGTWDTASRSVTALASGSLAELLFGASAILLPAGALGFLGYSGAKLVQNRVGGGTLAVAIGATVSVVIIGSILPEIFEPLDGLFLALDGNRYFVYSSGIGSLGSVLGNFLAISLLAGLVTLGAMLWNGRNSGGQGASSSM